MRVDRVYDGINYVPNLLRKEVMDRWKEEYLVVQ